MELTADEIARITGGAVVGGTGAVRATSYAIDSRVLEPGACFVALEAERDGHEFVTDAFARGATVALVARDGFGGDAAGPGVVRVADGLEALARLGAAARDRLSGATVVGITGSAGKTGTKDLVAAAASPTLRVHASPGSFNNEAGLPLTLLGAPGDTELIALEMGARAPGDIAALCAIARPNVGVITNIGMAHAGPLGGRDGVARVKGELLEALRAGDLAVLDADDPKTPDLVARTAARVVLVSAAGNVAAVVRAGPVELDAELHPSFLLETPWGSGAVQLTLRGEHQVVNAALAATVALERGVPFDAVVAGLATAQPAPWRMEVVRAASGLLVLDDSYNANPASMAAALRALARLDVSGRRVAVLGDMRELGGNSAREHTAIGELVADLSVDVLVAVGPETAPMAAAARERGIDTLDAPDATAALAAVAARVDPHDAVLVKGSRAVGLELVTAGLTGGDA
jgi:UDP-N-acetylmuramoyl-tripeptide--D-alanyl-D-alanine ligase